MVGLDECINYFDRLGCLGDERAEKRPGGERSECQREKRGL